MLCSPLCQGQVQKIADRLQHIFLQRSQKSEKPARKKKGYMAKVLQAKAAQCF